MIRARKGEFSEYITQSDLDKYIDRGLIKMPWTEMSQEEFLRYVATFPAELPKLMAEDKMLQVSLSLMEQVVRDPERLYRSVYKVLHNKDYRTLEAAQHSKGKKDGVTPSNKDSASATDKIAAIFTRRTGASGGTKGNANEAPASPKVMLGRSSRPGSIKTKNNPLLQRKCSENNDNDSITEDDNILCNGKRDTNSFLKSRTNSMIIQVPVS